MEIIFKIIDNIGWVFRQPVMFVLYLFILNMYILERIEILTERRMKHMKVRKALEYIGKIKVNWVKVNQDQRNILYGLDFMSRTFNKGISDAVHVAQTNPESIEEYMGKIHDELLSMCATPSAKVLLDDIFSI